MHDLIIIKAVVESTFNNINITDRARERRFCDARKIYAYISKKCTRYSLAKIGDFIKRDHSTIHHAVIKSQDLILTDDNFKNRVKHCMDKSINLLNINKSTYKNKVDVFWSNLSNEQQEEIYMKVSEMYAYNTGLKKEITYV